jgi:hypothetical protein
MSDKEKFYDLLAQYPFLEGCWDKDTHRANIEALNTACFASEQSTVKDVVLSIWNGGSNTIKVDITDLAALSPELKKPLLEWLQNPFWPWSQIKRQQRR